MACVLLIPARSIARAGSDYPPVPDKPLDRDLANWAAAHPLNADAIAAVQHAVANVDDGTPQAHEALADIKRQYGEAILPVLDEALRSESSKRRHSGLIAVATFFVLGAEDRLVISDSGEDLIRSLLVRQLGDADATNRISAVGMLKSLSSSGCTSAREGIAQQLAALSSDSDAKVRLATAFYLIQLGRGNLVPKNLADKIRGVE